MAQQESQEIARAMKIHACGAHPVRIQTFGGLDIRFKGESLLADRGALRRILELLRYFLTFRSKRMLPETIINDMWPLEEFADPKSILRTQVFRLRGLVKEMHAATGLLEKPWMSLTFSSGHYVLQLEDKCEMDVDAFERIVERAESTEERDISASTTLYKQALAFYKGPYMDGEVRGEWLFPVQNRYHRAYLNALFSLLALLEKAGSYREIIEVCEKAFPFEPHDETLHLYFLKALVELEDTKSALSHYNYITSFLYKELGVRPSASLQAFYRELQRRTQNRGERNLTLIKRNLVNEDDMVGALHCDIDQFRFLCHTEIRRSLRTGDSSFLGLFSFEGLNEPSATPKGQALAENITGTLRSSLRKGDVFTWWNQNQILLLLAVQDRDSLNRVGQRLCGKLKEVMGPFKIGVRLEFQLLTSEAPLFIK